LGLRNHISYALERPQENSNAEGRAGRGLLGCCSWASYGELLFYGVKRWPDEEARHSSGEKTGKGMKTSGSKEAGVCQRVTMTLTASVMELETRMGQGSGGTTGGRRWNRRCGRYRSPAWSLVAWCSWVTQVVCVDAAVIVSQVQGDHAVIVVLQSFRLIDPEKHRFRPQKAAVTYLTLAAQRISPARPNRGEEKRSGRRVGKRETEWC
jgi:hypothetical protein